MARVRMTVRFAPLAAALATAMRSGAAGMAGAVAAALRRLARTGGLGRAGALAAVAAVLLAAAEPALAKDLGDMAKKSAGALEDFPLVIQILFYVVGGFLVLMGFYKFKRNIDQPQQQSMMGAVVTVLVGVCMVLFPEAISMIGGTLDLSPGGTIQRPKLQ